MPWSTAARPLAALIACTLWLTGCATYSERMRLMEQALARQDPAAALAQLEADSGRRRNRPLHYLHKGMLLRMGGDYAASNEAFAVAKKLMDDNQALSLREQAGTVLLNEETTSYVGDPHERILLHFYMALNYLQLGKRDDARVEALQADLRLRDLAREPSAGAHGDYHDDAAMRYLSGIIFETLGAWSDAMIAYRKAYQAYRDAPALYPDGIPTSLKTDLLRLAQRLGLDDELQRYRDEFAITERDSSADLQRQGELILLFNNGLAPIKREHSIMVSPLIYHSDNVHVLAVYDSHSLIRISTPYYQSRSAAGRRIRVSIAGNDYHGAVIEDVDRIARASLARRMPAIIARAVLRAALKKELQDRAADRNGVLGLATAVAAVASEIADTRSWFTLPHDIQLTRIALPPGHYALDLTLLDAGGKAVQNFHYPDIEIRAGDRTFLSRYWISPLPLRERTR